MMPRSKVRAPNGETLNDRDFEAISKGEETKRSDCIWNYYEAHKDEAVDLGEYEREASRSDSKPQLALLTLGARRITNTPTFRSGMK